jgi:hypothetical protein
MTRNKSHKRSKKSKSKTSKSKTRKLKKGGFTTIDTSKIHPASIILRKI